MRCSISIFGLLSAVLLFLSVAVGSDSKAAEQAPATELKKQVEALVSFARSAKNSEAIALYESLPADADIPLVALRAVAGCYWREQQFEKSRELYQKILDRRPTLHKLSKSPVEEPSPLLAKEEPEAADAPKVDAEEDAAAAEKAEALAAELAELRKANEQLTKDREAMRERTAAQIASVTAAAESSAAASETLRAKLAEEQKAREAAEAASERVQRELEERGDAVQGKIVELEAALEEARSELSGAEKAQKREAGELERELAKAKAELAGLKKTEKVEADETQAAAIEELEGALKAARSELSDLNKSRKREVEELEKAVGEAKEGRSEEILKIQEIQQSLEAKELVLNEQVVELDAELQSARASVEQGKLEAAEQLAASEARKAELEQLTETLELRVVSAKSDMAKLSRALEEARIKNAELSAAKADAAAKTASEMERMEKSALQSALAEIDALELDYAKLDASASKRQRELLMRIDALEQASVTGETDIEELRKQLEIERSLREAMEAQGEKRDDAMLQANRVLAEATEKMALHFDAICSQMEGSPRVRIDDGSKHSADLAPLIGKLESATESATVEVRELRAALAAEQEQHALTKAKTTEEIASLRRQVELLTQETDAIRSSQKE
ncbi:MAG: hypothetical protein HN341_14305, partial [Verrucomicrobia bacterium]|nr:hypothetical protein [Verrucomicrobiota bacterium]